MGKGQEAPVQIEVRKAVEDLLPVVYAKERGEAGGEYRRKIVAEKYRGKKRRHRDDKQQGRGEPLVAVDEFVYGLGRLVEKLAHEQIAGQDEENHHAQIAPAYDVGV